jgi:RES domain-containing protein
VSAAPADGGVHAEELDDRELVRRLGRLEPASIDVAVWLHLGLNEVPGSGEGARGSGGRFNPPNSFPAVYGSLGRATACAEFRRLAQRNTVGLANLLPRHVYRFRLRSMEVCDLRSPQVLERLGMPMDGLASVPSSRTQLIGELARSLGIAAIVAPSVTGIGDVAVIFSDLIPRSAICARHVELWTTIDDLAGKVELPVIQPAGQVNRRVAS